MDIWIPAQSESEVSFWKPSPESEEGSIWIPSSESEGSFWKPSLESKVSICKPSRFWKWKSEGGSVLGWKPGICRSSSESEESHPSLEYNITETWCHWYSDEAIENVQRRFRRDVAKQFRKEYKFEHGKKTFIWSNGIYPWPGKCYDLLWVAVHGTDSICVVTKNKNVNMKRVGSYYQRYYTNEQALLSLTEALISEIECLPCDDEEFRGKGIEKPFGVVSVIPGTKKVNAERGHEVSSAEYDEEKAIRYLEKTMKSHSAFTLKKTIRRAIYAFQILCCQEFLAEDIWVTVLDGKGPVEHLDLLQKMRHLAVVGGYSFLSRSAVFSAHCPLIGRDFQVS